jgi:hypothetical protein
VKSKISLVCDVCGGTEFVEVTEPLGKRYMACVVCSVPPAVGKTLLLEAEQMTRSICSLSAKLQRGLRDNAGYLPRLDAGEQMTLMWILGTVEALALDREQTLKKAGK